MEAKGASAAFPPATRETPLAAPQTEAVAESLDVGRALDLATSVLSGTAGILSNLFFIITLLLFLAFDSAHVSSLASEARKRRASLVDALVTFTRGTRSYLAVSAVFGLIVADRFGGAILRQASRMTLHASRRRALTLNFARTAAERLAAARDPNCW